MKASTHVQQYFPSGEPLLELWKSIICDVRYTTDVLLWLQRSVGSDSYTPNPALDQVRKSVRDSRWSWAIILSEVSSAIAACAMLADACSDTLLQEPTISEADIGTTLFLIVVDVNKLRGQVLRLANRVLGFSVLWRGAAQDAMLIGIGRLPLPGADASDSLHSGRERSDNSDRTLEHLPNADTRDDVDPRTSSSYVHPLHGVATPVSLMEGSSALLQGHLRHLLAYFNNWMQNPTISERSNWSSIELDRDWLESNWSCVPCRLDECLAVVKLATSGICGEPPTIPFPLES